MTEPHTPVDMISLLRGRKDDPPHLKRLRLAVVGMGLVLMTGVATVVTRIVYLSRLPAALTEAQSGPDAASRVDPRGTDGARMGAAMGEMRLLLPPGSTVRSHAVSGQNLSVLYEGASGSGIIVFDLASGRQTSIVRLESTVK